MELVRLNTIEQLKQYRDEWSCILEGNQNTNPFIEYEWIYQWWMHLGNDSNVEIMLVKKEGKPVAFAPFLYEKKMFGYQYSFMALGQANYMDFIADKRLLESVIMFIFDEIIHIRKNVVFYLHGLLDSSETLENIKSYLINRKTTFSLYPVVTPYIDLEKIKLSEYMDKRKRLHRLDRREKRLHENGRIKISRSNPDEIDYIFKLHDKRWKRRRDTSGFTKEKEKEFYRGLARINEGPMRTEIDSLYINDTMIAFNYGFNCRGRFLGYVLGYDDDFETFGPGRILEKEIILKCKNSTFRIFDLSVGFESYKFDWNTHLDYTSKIIFSSDTIMARCQRFYLTFKEKVIHRMKEKYGFVLFIRNTIGNIFYLVKNFFGQPESKNVRAELKDFFVRIKNRMYENKGYFVYKIEKKDIPDFPQTKRFMDITLNDAMECINIESKRMKDICRKMYGGYKGYYPKGDFSYENIFWINEKVLRIDEISYLEEFRKSSVCFENWNERNLVEACTLVKKNSKARMVYVSVDGKAKKERSALEEIGFSICKQIIKKSYFGFEKHHVTES